VVLDPSRDRVKMGKFCGDIASEVSLTPGRFFVAHGTFVPAIGDERIGALLD
jgi:hypothetical protein